MRRTGYCLLCPTTGTFTADVDQPGGSASFDRHAQDAHGIPDYIMRDTWRAPSNNVHETWLLPGKVADYGSDDATPWLHIVAE